MKLKHAIPYIKDQVCKHRFSFKEIRWCELMQEYDEIFECEKCGREIWQGHSPGSIDYGKTPRLWRTCNDRGDKLKVEK